MEHLRTAFTRLVGVEHPVVQDGMGPHSTSALAAAVSNAGGLGTVSVPGRSVEPSAGRRILLQRIAQTASRTDKPFAVNIPVPRDADGITAPAAAFLDAVTTLRRTGADEAEHLVAVITSAGFPFELRDAIQEAGLVHLAKVGSTRHALKAQAAGADAVIASGYEMGGHTHSDPVHTFVLVPNVTEALDIPVLLSGGARDGRSLAAALCLGAAGIAMGTRFIASDENEWHPAYRQAIVRAGEGDDEVVEGPARILRAPTAGEAPTTADRELDEALLAYEGERRLLLAQRDGDFETGVVAAGQVASGIDSVASVADLVPRIAADAARILSSLHTEAVVRD